MEAEGEIISEFIELLAEPEDTSVCLLTEDERLQTILVKTAQQLFHQVEAIGRIYDSQGLHSSDGKKLSGLEELYMGGGDDDEPKVDSEMLWGQVDLQNTALQSLLKHSIRRLSKDTKRKGARKQIRLLEDFESDDAGEDNSDREIALGGSATDRDTTRIQERMGRAMADMMEDEEEEEEGGQQREVEKDDEDVEDPARDELDDGFFDLHEMQAFADEEEKYLPDSAYGEENPEEDEGEKDKRSFHQMQRDGDVRDAESEDEDRDLLSNKVSLVRRKRYRAEDEIEALYGLYSGSSRLDDDVINITAADLFGGPRKRTGERNTPNRSAKTNETFHEGSENDSWNDYDFNSRDIGEESGWNDFDPKENDGDGHESMAGHASDEHGNVEKASLKSRDHRETLTKESRKKKALEAQTEELEREMLAEKPWQMIGEASSTARPTNSLLDSTPEFQVATKMAPSVTVEHTESLEDVIKARILNQDFDDVIPRELPDVGWHTRRGELPEVSQEKSKLGLGELYEREYLKKAVGYDVEAAGKEQEEDKARNEMKALFANLCSKLDALSNYHFAPRPIEEEAEVRPVTKPAVAMEEVLPLHVSDARGVAPEEIYGTKRGRESILRADSEMDQQDRKRLRASKKAARRKRRRQKKADEKLISRLQPGLGLNNPYEKRKMQEELSAARARGKVSAGQIDTNDYNSSGTFFKRMQQEAQQSIRGKKQTLEADVARTDEKSSKSSYLKL